MLATWKGESDFLLNRCIFDNFPSHCLTKGRWASTDLVVAVVMGVCKSERVKLIARGDRRGGSEGRQSCASTGLDKERMVAGAIEQGECSIFYHVIILFMVPCCLIPAPPSIYCREPTKREGYKADGS